VRDRGKRFAVEEQHQPALRRRFGGAAH
jgi:hypothetical protein